MTARNEETKCRSRQILVVDDEGDVGEIISATAQALNFDCCATTNAADFIAALCPDISLILVDLVMPGTDGVELLRFLGQQSCKANIILMSGFDKRVLETAEELGKSLGLSVVGRLQKPFRVVELEEILRTQARVSAPQMTTHQQSIAVTDGGLRRAIERDEFVLHYQPQLDIVTGQVVGVEALVRWQHPEHVLVFPDHFICRMESLNLIDQLGWIVAERGLTEIRRFSRKDGVSMRLSVNVSAQSLHDLQFPDKLVGLAKKCGVHPASVILEITESGLIRELSRALDIFTRLRMKGVQLSIDDFGTGYAMMQQMRYMPATELKIAKEFVQEMHIKSDARIVVHKIIELGHELGMKVLAEGVETAAQLEYLHAGGCDLAQGYYISHPLPAPELLNWLETSPYSC